MALSNNARVLWSTGKVDDLIAHFKANPCLYDRKTRAYNDKALRLEAFRTIADEMQISYDDVYRKIVNLRSQFRREKHREVKFASEGNAQDAASQIKWIHYKQLKFLDDFVTLRNPRTDCVQYSPTNGFGDFDESFEDDVEYDGLDVDEYKVGLEDNTNERTIDLTAGESPQHELHNAHTNNYDFHRQSPMQERGAKRVRQDFNAPHQELSERRQFPNSTAPERHQHQVLENTHSSGRECIDPSQSAVMQRASSHIQKALSCFEKAGGNTRYCRRCDGDDDDDMIFAKYIATELRQLPSGDTKRLVKHQIQNLIYGAHCKPHTLQSS
ncbi:uncharacterized protein LOC575812 [Strongylocentrotus purpuratus]|uniref:MADF domain-containing protein n=1 Tax=Strongylocentrotus purpuratus TaxID=7668 RepID=A0A7M7RHV4_STRPU|nr:uncharacterized protein LOC575812 [Strongylocentrotus purpuratus]